jgi:hypothetical protein
MSLLELLWQTFAAHLYNPNNIDPIKCSNNGLCLQNISLSYTGYENVIHDGSKTILSRCAQPAGLPKIVWTQIYLPYQTWRRSDYGSFHCNTPNCRSNSTIIKTFRRLAREYILSLNVSVLNVTTNTIVSTTVSTTLWQQFWIIPRISLDILTASSHALQLFFSYIKIFFNCTFSYLSASHNVFNDGFTQKYEETLICFLQSNEIDKRERLYILKHGLTWQLPSKNIFRFV